MKLSDPFFIGYKAMPVSLKWFYAMIAMFLLAGSAVFSYTVASQQQVDGQGVWNTSEEVSIEGYLTVDPYPVLHKAESAADGLATSVLMVMEGKHSANDIADAYADTMVSVRGYPVSRGGWLMLELTGSDAITPLNSTISDSDRMSIVDAESLGTVTLTGEVVGSKCFLGVMNPGSGPVHKACADICLLGGVPPLLVVRDKQQRKFGYLLTRADGSSAARQLMSAAAESVQISGELSRKGDLLYLAIGSLNITDQTNVPIIQPSPTLFASLSTGPRADDVCSVAH
jgi:hypothetical protein